MELQQNPYAVDLNSPVWLITVRKNLRGELVALVFPEVVPLTELEHLECAMIRQEQTKRDYHAALGKSGMAKVHEANVAARAPRALPATTQSVDELFTMIMKGK